MSGITMLEPGRFRIDFGRLGATGGFTGRFRAMFGGAANKTVDLYRIGLAVTGVMSHSSERDVDGTLLAWNEFRIYLARSDFDRLRALQARLEQGLHQRIHQQLEAMRAETVGDPMIRVLVDEESDLPPGVGEVLVSYVANEKLAPPSDGEVTVRVPSSRPRLRPAPQAAAPAESTERVQPVAASAGPGIRLRWAGGSADVHSGHRAQVGRPHDGAPAGFVSLTGATKRINSAHFHIESGADGVLISRPIRSNPVRVNDQLLQPGGRIVVTDLPAAIELSNGELTITVEPA